jgi:NAD(P)H dehydrogenase (quinone)
MNTGIPKILITGASGQVGSEVLRRLAGNSRVDVMAATRNPEGLRGKGVAVRTLDYDRHETIRPALEGVSRVFLLTAYTVDMLRQSKALIDEAVRSGVEHIVHLEPGYFRFGHILN